MSNHWIPAGERHRGAPAAVRLAGHPAFQRRFRHLVWILALIAGLGNAPPPSSAHQITIGSGTSLASYPLRTTYAAARTQAIYLASEIGTGGTVTCVAVRVSAAGTPEVTRRCTIGLKHTSGSTLGQFEEGASIVYDHTVTINTVGWMEFPLDTPFVYNGTDNLLVDFVLRGDGVSTTATRCYASSVPNMTVVAFNATADADLALGTTASARPNLQLTIGPAVTSVTPWEGENTGPVSITNLAGAHFEDGASVLLVGGGGHIHGTGVTVVSPTQIACTFNITGAPPGLYDVVVTNSDGTSGQKNGCFVVNGMAGLLPVEVEGLRAVRTRTGAVAVRWSAAAGVEVAGYRLWRARSARGPFVRVGGRLITSGARAFQALDAGARGLAHCVYRLDVVGVAGRVIRSFRVTAPPAPRAPAPNRARR